MDKPTAPTPRPSGPAHRRGRPSISLLLLAAIAVVGLGIRFGFLRSLIAVAIFGVIALFGSRQMRSMVSIPPEPELSDVSDSGLRYVCTMCGLELKVEKTAHAKPPSHCMEPMALVDRGGPVTSG